MKENFIYIPKRNYIPPIVHKIEMEYCVVAGSLGATTPNVPEGEGEGGGNTDPFKKQSKESLYRPFASWSDEDDDEY